MKLARAFVAVGSNIDPAVNVRAAIRALALQVQVTGVSTIYRTEPERRPDQAPFYNGVVEIQTRLSPRSLKFQVLRGIEAALGRQRTSDKDAPRTIDLDLIVYDDLVLNTGGLVLPDPDIARRPFLAVPLRELAPDLAPAETVRPAGAWSARLPGVRLRPLRAYTARLRRDIRGGNGPAPRSGNAGLKRRGNLTT